MMNLYLALAFVCLLVADVNAGNVNYGKACTSSDTCMGTDVNPTCPTTANKLFCTCKVSPTDVGGLIGKVNTDCKAKCDASYLCGAGAECTSAKTGCQCKDAKVYDAAANEMTAADGKNFNCKDAGSDAACKSATGTTTTIKYTSPKCGCSDAKKVLTWQKKDGKYSCEDPPASGSQGIYAFSLGIAIMAAIAMLG